MKAHFFILFLLLTLSGLAQDVPKNKLLNHDYYTQNPPAYKIFGEQSKMLKKQYGAEFLSVGERYVQVYNYASYYNWLFQFHANLFPDKEDYEKYFIKRNSDRMFSYIKINKTKINKITNSATPSK